MDLKKHIKNIHDFPKPGILFRDVNPLFQSPELSNFVINQLGSYCEKYQPDYIAGIEARGFIVGSALSNATGIGFIPIRKKGKLPGEIISYKYELEYGTDSLEIQKDCCSKGSRVLLVDDLLATGGTAKAASDLLSSVDVEVVAIAFIVELSELNGRDKLDKSYPIISLVKY